MKNNRIKEKVQVSKSVSITGVKKGIAIFLHLLSLVVLVIGVAYIMRSPNFTKGIQWMNAKQYEDSELFVSRVEDDASMLFQFMFLKNIFETDGFFDEGKSLFTIEKSQGLSEEYTIRDVMELSKELGFYFDSDFQVLLSDAASQSRFPSDRDTDKKYLVSWKAYGDFMFEEASTMDMSISDLVFESMEYLGRYYFAKKHTDMKQTNLRYRLTFGERIDTNDESFVYDDLKKYGRYAAVSSESPMIETNLPRIPDNLKYLSDMTSARLDSTYQVMLAIDTDYLVEDRYSLDSTQYQIDRNYYFRGIVFLIAGFFGMFITLVYMTVLIGAAISKDKKQIIAPMDKLGVEVNVILAILFGLFMQYLYRNSIDKILGILFSRISLAQSRSVMSGVTGYLCFLVVFCSMIRSRKAGVLYEYSFTKKIVDGFGIFKTSESYAQGLLRNFVLFCLMNLGFAMSAVYIFFRQTSLIEQIVAIIIVLLILMMDMVLYNRLYRNIVQREKIADALHSMFEQNEACQLDVEDFDGREAQMAKDLNNISQGLKKVVSEQVKSEKMKADLITNVSHDLRTPLTNIVSYIGLIRKENPTQPKILEHIQTIENSAQRLKNLTDDLLEASRAASGSINLDMKDIDIVSLVKQANGEFEEKYEERQLTIVSDLPKETIMIKADGQRLWRVLENLYSNAYKYAAAQSRVYVTMLKKEKQVVFTIKNTSQAALNISPEELTERFVRGDVSRSTAGHGLGLSIARSLTELQEGKFDISIDADLFTAKITFAILETAEMTAH